jgi:Concanavalin A-like lectin/glucanases superfamily
MGLLPSADVAWPIQYLINARPLSAEFDPMTQTQYQDFDADGIGELSRAEIVAKYGERTPAPAAAQTPFKLGIIVVYDRPLSEVELTYYDMFAREYGKPSSTWSNFTAFGSATSGRTEMSTLLLMCARGVRLERLGNGQVLVSWPLPECGYILYHSTTLKDWTPMPPPYQINADNRSAVRPGRAEFFQLRRPPEADLLAHYAFEGSAVDLTGNSPPMELRNTTFTNGTLFLNGIYEFASDPGGFHASARIIGLSYDSFTVALDFRAAEFAKFSNHNILTGGRDYRWFSLWHNAGRLEVTLNQNGFVYLISNSRLKTNQWQSVICSVDVSAKRIITFLDGQRLEDIVLTPDFNFEVVGTSHESTDRLFTFTHYGGGSAFHGYVDNLKVWARALSASEIEAMPSGAQIHRAAILSSSNGH